MTKLQRSFLSREELAHSFLRRLSQREMEVELPGESALPVGTAIELDLRLADGSPLIVGLGEVGGTGDDTETRRVRFIGLDEGSRAELPGLVALSDAAAGARTAAPAAASRDPDETLQDLVAGVFGERPQRPGPDDTILVPPEPPTRGAPAEPPAPSPAPAARLAAAAPPAAVEPPREVRTPAIEHPPAAAAPPPPARPPAEKPEEPRRRPSLFRRFQVSPAVIVASIIAGATGAAANAWFEDLANVFADADSRATDKLVAAPVVDVVPRGIEPSRFPEPETPAAAAEPATRSPAPGPAANRTEPTSAPGLPTAPDPVPASAEAGSAAAPAAASADRVRLITWDEQATGTVVTFWGNGEFLPERVVRFRVGGSQPREVVKLRGIDLPFPQTVLDLGTPEVVRVRTGFHPQEPVNELHVVLDLAGPDVVLERVETAPQKLRLHLRRESAIQ